MDPLIFISLNYYRTRVEVYKTKLTGTQIEPVVPKIGNGPLRLQVGYNVCSGSLK